jgi:enoyl-CoA hydratase
MGKNKTACVRFLLRAFRALSCPFQPPSCAAMPYQHLTLSVQDRIATLTVNRPDKLNALNAATIGELGAAIDEVLQRDDVGGVILTGAGRAFIAGADISELTGKSALEGKRLARRGQEIFRRFETSPKPTVAAVNGFALGGGCELAMACHIRIAAEAAKFGQPEVKLGLIPGYGGTQRLPRLVGRGRALQLLLTGEMIDAQEAYRIGLVNRVVAADQLIPAATTMVQQMLMNAPLGVAGCIDAVDRGLEMPLDDALALEAASFGVLIGTTDTVEGTRAFLEKRAPRFTGA